MARKLEREQADAVRAFKNERQLRGVRLEPDTKRYYPNSSLACHLIGFVGTDNYGLEGIEARYDSVLSGTAGRTRRMTNAFGTDLLFEQFEEFEPGRDGCSVVTTIDETIQYYVEKHLKQAVADYDIQNGAGAIVMDVNTGEILAMASLDRYDLNHFLDVSEEAEALIAAAPDEEEAQRIRSAAQIRQWRNKALSDTYEPGSTFKIITLAMVLEEGVVSEQSSFFCPGSVSVKGRSSPIRCWKDGGHGSQNLTQAVQHSCNAALVNIGLRVGAEPELSGEEAARMDVQTPVLGGLPRYEAKNRVSEAGLRCRTIGIGDTVTDQLPAAGQSIARGTEIILYLGAAPSKDLETLPDLTGMGYEEARDTLSYYGLYLRTASPIGAAGTQIVGGQSAAAGTALDHGSVITVTLIDSDETMLGIY